MNRLNKKIDALILKLCILLTYLRWMEHNHGYATGSTNVLSNQYLLFKVIIACI